jgi:hypothetical protein
MGGAKRMQLDIGGIVAKCFLCGSKEFESLRPSAHNRSDRLACVRCCTEVVYDDLLSQIGRAAIAKRRGLTQHVRRSHIG